MVNQESLFDAGPQEFPGDLVERRGISSDRDRFIGTPLNGVADAPGCSAAGAGALGELSRLLFCFLRDSALPGSRISFFGVGIFSCVSVAQAIEDVNSLL